MEQQPSMDDQFLRIVNRIINDNLDNEHFSVEDLAHQAGLSRSMLHRKLTKLTGKSASDLITETRLAKAKELLENNVATASEIAYKVGFSDPSYFNKVFKKHFNISPGDVRKKAVIDQDILSTDQQPEIPGPSKLKINRLVALAIIIICIIGGGLYYLISIKKSSEMSVAVLPLRIPILLMVCKMPL
jgi:AraC-like DNA-binding protein